MQTRQDKTETSGLAAKPTESIQKATRGSGSSVRQPGWTSAWGDHPPARLVASVADLQAKRALSQPGDPSEQEADHIADQVMNMTASGTSMISVPPDPPKVSFGLVTSMSHVPPMIQRATFEEGTTSAPLAAESTPEITPTSATATAEPAPGRAAPGETPTPGLIVDDTVDQLGPGQMKKSDFLAQLRSAVCTTTEQALTGTIWSAAGCPWVDHWFGYYGNRDSQQIERAIRRYAPETLRVTTASDYIPIICERVRRAIAVWSTTGEVMGVPEGVPADMSEASAGEGLTETSSITGAEGSSFSVPTVSFKGRESGAREASNPQAIQSQLGTGRSLESGVRSQMESVFGVDFSHVRIHTDATAAELSESLNARAFTVGHDVAFASGEYQPGTLIGDALIAHELAHTVQQGGASASTEPLRKGNVEYNSLEEDADVSAVGAMVSLWSGTKGIVTNITQNTMPRLKSGLGLQRCAGTQRRPSTVPTQRQPLVARPPAVIPNWGASVRTTSSISDLTQRRSAMVNLVRQALSGTGIQVAEGPAPVEGTSSLGEVNPNDYQEAPVLNFDVDLNRRTGISGTRGSTNLSGNVGYFFTRGSRAYAIIGPRAIREESPDYIRMYAEHELYHTQHHVGTGESFADQELETWTHDFRNNFHLLYRYRMQWAPLISYYQRASGDARGRTLDALVDYYNNPPVPATSEQGSRETFAQQVKRAFARWLRRRLREPGSASMQLIQDLESRLHLGSSPSSQGEESSPAPGNP
jgi:hypothetical protein